MAFDPTTAQPVSGGFDPSTAQPVSSGFDPTTAQPANVPNSQRTNAQGQHPNFIQSAIMDLSDNPVVKGLSGAYMQAVTNGPVMQLTRAAMENMGVGMDELKQRYPGQSDDWYKQQLHNAYSQAVTLSRQQAQQQTQNNPYPGHQIGNFLAGVAGSPEMLALGGAGTGATVGARIASAAVKNAAISSGADAVSQGLDMLEGQKKDFDIQQNLTQAVTGGIVGGAMHGVAEAAPVVSDFVKSLYKARGTDTTPPPTPTGTLRPQTGQGLTPSQLQEYHQVLQTGNVGDIKAFFDDKNGVIAPSYQDITDWVNRRDNDLITQNKTPDQLTTDMLGTPDMRQAVTDHITQQTANWKNAPDFEVINHTDDIQDPQVRQQAVQAGADDPNALGFVGSDGKVRIFANRLGDTDPEATLNSVLYHESLGHYGLQQAFGDKLDNTLNTLITRNVGQFGRDVADWQKANPDAYGGNKLRAAEEVLAEMSQNGQLKPSVSDAVTAAVRQFGRRMGIEMSYNDAEVRQILRMAHDAVVNGKGRDVPANGFKTGSYQATDLGANNTAQSGDTKFMFTGPRATGFDPSTAIPVSDGVPRNEISDANAKLNPMEDETSAPLGDVLDHPELYKQYPHLKDLPVVHTEMDPSLKGAYSPKTKRLYLNTLDTDPASKLSTTLHEVQHAVQDHENIPGVRGGDNLNSSDEDYSNSPIEKEAHLTEARAAMSDLQRSGNVPVFMRRSQLAASAGYVPEALEDTFKALDQGYQGETRGWDEVRRDALAAGFKPSDIKDLGDVGDLSKKLWRMQSAANMTTMRIQELNKKLNTPEWSMGDKMEYLKAIADLNELIPRIQNNKSEIARALQVSKAFAYTKAGIQALGEKLKEADSGLAPLVDDDTKFMKFAKGIQQMLQQGNQKGAVVKLQNVNKPYWEQYLNTFHFNAMLSGLSTHVKAPVDMGTGILRNVLEKIVAMPIGKARNLYQALTGQTITPGVTALELYHHVYGLGKAFMDLEVYRQMAIAAKTGEGKLVMPDGSVKQTNVANAYGSMSNPHIPVVSIPTQLISAQDTFFRSLEMGAQLRSLASREAVKRLPNHGILDQDALATSLAMNPTQKMIDEAYDLTNRTLLLNSNPLNKALDKFRVYSPGMTVGQRVGTFIVGNLAPFIRVESNSIINRIVQRSPLAFLDSYTRQQLAAGGAQADIALSKILYGTATLGFAWAAADKAKGYLTGHQLSDNPNKTKELEAGGMLPDAVHENGRYDQSSNLAMSVFPWDQHNAVAQMVADVRKNMSSGKDVGTELRMAAMSVFKDLSHMSWLNDIAPAVDAATSPEQGKFAQFVGNEASTFVPNIANQIERLNDVKRDERTQDPDNITGNVLNQVSAKVPGLAGSLPVKYSVYGEPVPTGASVTGVHTWVNPGNGVEEPKDPTIKELSRLASLTPAAVVTPVQRTVNINGTKIKLYPDQFEDYQKYAGQTLVQAVRDQQQSGQWDQLSDADKIRYIKDTQKQAKEEVRDALAQQPGWLKPDQLRSLQNGGQ